MKKSVVSERNIKELKAASGQSLMRGPVAASWRQGGPCDCIFLGNLYKWFEWEKWGLTQQRAQGLLWEDTQWESLKGTLRN